MDRKHFIQIGIIVSILIFCLSCRSKETQISSDNVESEYNVSESNELSLIKSEIDESEGAQEPSSETEFSENQVEVPCIEYVIDSELDHYYLCPFDNGIRKEGDVYVIEGEVHYADSVILTWEQKALLDAGAVLKIIYNGAAVDEITALMTETYDSALGNVHVVRYRGENGYGKFTCKLGTDPYLEEPDRQQLLDAPYNGIGFYLKYAENIPKAYFVIVLDEQFRLELSADTLINPENYIGHYYYRDNELLQELQSKTWTIADYYDIGIIQDGWQGSMFEIITEAGEVIKINEPYWS